MTLYQQFRVLGWILLVIGILSTVSMLAVGAFQASILFGMGAAMSAIPPSQAPPGFKAPPPSFFLLPGGILFAVVAFGLAVAVLDIVAGAGLLGRRPWARGATIASSIISLPGMPFWTALGVYGLWLMYSVDGARAWEEYVRGAGGVQGPEGR